MGEVTPGHLWGGIFSPSIPRRSRARAALPPLPSSPCPERGDIPPLPTDGEGTSPCPAPTLSLTGEGMGAAATSGALRIEQTEPTSPKKAVEGGGKLA